MVNLSNSQPVKLYNRVQLKNLILNRFNVEGWNQKTNLNLKSVPKQKQNSKKKWALNLKEKKWRVKLRKKNQIKKPSQIKKTIKRLKIKFDTLKNWRMKLKKK